jgi:DNA-binding transcriptional MocR family regulator
MSRGKPGPEQLDLALDMLNCLGTNDYKAANGTDCRIYGGVDGLPEIKNIMAGCLGVSPANVIAAGNSSLNLMHDIIARAMIHGVLGSPVPWGKLPTVKFLCPSPGYDRHFALCEYFNIEMITIPLLDDGPDMNQVEALVASDESIKGIWCVPRYSNPTGIVYSDAVVERLATMKTKAPDFRIFWDNAYAVHHLSLPPQPLANILEVCQSKGNPDRVFIFGSTSKISFAGSGIAAMAMSPANINWLKKQMGIQTIGPDKINQLRHVRFYRDMAGVEAHMKKQAALIKPKFEIVEEILEKELGGKNIATWTKPQGGYFISLNTMDHCARRVVSMAAEAGVVLTPAGATYPYGKDPLDNNIRIAPTYPPLDELRLAMEVVATCIQLVSIEKILGE